MFLLAALLGGSAAVGTMAIFPAHPPRAAAPPLPFAVAAAVSSVSTSSLAARLRAHVRALVSAPAGRQGGALASALAPGLASTSLPASAPPAGAGHDAGPDAAEHAAAAAADAADAATAADGAAAADRPAMTARYIDAMLHAAGYTVRRADGPHGVARGAIEASLSNLAPGTRPARLFVVGARYGDGAGSAPVDAAGVAAVLELARLLKTVRPSRGTEIRFAFVDGPGRTADDGFIAFVGTRDAAHRVQQALAAFRNGADGAVPERGLAAHAYVQGDILSTPSGHAGPAMLVTDTAFMRYPYYATGPIADDASKPEDDTEAASAPCDYDAVARVLAGLARTIEALAAARQG